MCSADLLILLSDINGLYSSDPNKNKSTVFIEEIPEITDEIERMGGPPIKSTSSGGMVTKIAAAKIGKVAFFEPDIFTVPTKLLLPLTISFCIR